MAEQVGMDTRRVEAGLRGQLPQDEKRPGAGERPALGIEEELGPVPLVEVWATTGEVAAHGLHAFAAEGDDSLLVSLAQAADEPVLQVDAAALEPDCFADPQSRPVEKLDERAVAEGTRGRSVRRLDQALDLARRKGAGEPGAAFRQVELGRGIVGPLAHKDQVVVEGPRGRGSARDRGRGLSAA